MGDGETQKLVTCRMNRNFIVFMREHYPHVANEQFEFGTILMVQGGRQQGGWRWRENCLSTIKIYLFWIVTSFPPTTHLYRFVELFTPGLHIWPILHTCPCETRKLGFNRITIHCQAEICHENLVINLLWCATTSQFFFLRRQILASGGLDQTIPLVQPWPAWSFFPFPVPTTLHSENKLFPVSVPPSFFLSLVSNVTRHTRGATEHQKQSFTTRCNQAHARGNRASKATSHTML